MLFKRNPNVLIENRKIFLIIIMLNNSYINWNLHEPEKGQYNFSGDLDFVKFLKLAQELDFVVILRPGPFINAECDMVILKLTFKY